MRMRYFWDYCVSTHSRLKAAAVWIAQYYPIVMFQHTAARRRLDFHAFFLVRIKRFQHTAARRRLAGLTALLHSATRFQHTAARRRLDDRIPLLINSYCFNTQPPEGGWATTSAATNATRAFQHTAARRRLDFPSVRRKK